MLSMMRIPNIHAGLTKSFAKLALILSVPLIMGNLSALIDHFLHPEIPYFDEEHLIVGGISALVTAFFIIMLAIYIENLHRSRREVQTLNAELELKVEKRTKQLVDAQEELIRKEKLAILGQLSGSVGHELRNPLGVMNNAVYFLKTVLPESDETVHEYLNMIKSEIDISDRIISDLLDFSRTKTPKMELTAVSELMNRSLGKCSVPENVELETNIPDTLPLLDVDPLQMTQVFQNLITNACQAMPEGGELRISARPGADFVEISITDTGEGISPENMKKMFHPLFTTKTRGIGLGLVASNNLVKANGGKIDAESELGKGTTFTVMLPCEREQ